MNCSICGKEITTSVSVKRGIGPLCYEKLKRDEKRGNSLPGEKVLTTGMGGEIEELIKETALKSYYCLGLPKGHTEMEVVISFPHIEQFIVIPPLVHSIL